MDFFEIYFQKFKEDEKLKLTQNYSIFFLSTFIISIFVFNLSYYKHQYIPVIIIIFLGIIRYLIIMSKIFNIKISVFFFELFLNIIYNICKSFSYVFLKIIMEKTYFSPFKLCYLIGFINGFILLMVFFILLGISRDKEEIPTFSIEYKHKYYFDNILSVLKGYNLGELFLFIFNYSYYPIAFILVNITIQNFTLCHIFLPYQIRELVNNITSYTDNIFPMIIILILEIFMTLIFLEIIELKFWGINKNIKRNIEIRAIEDASNSFNANSLIEIDNYITKIDDAEKE